MIKGGIYCILNTKNGKRYIGSTKCFKSRFSKHKSDLIKRKHHSFLLQRAWDKYGANMFEFKILEELSDAILYKEREQYYLNVEHCEYNLDKQVNKGMLGKKHTKKTKLLISEANKTLCGEKNHMYGKSKELHHNYGKKMPQNGKSGQNHPNYGKLSCNRKIVLQFNIDGTFLKEFSSLQEASVQLNIDKSYIRQCCKGKFKTAKGFIFQFKQV